jgi:hypothetical protein
MPVGAAAATESWEADAGRGQAATSRLPRMTTAPPLECMRSAAGGITTVSVRDVVPVPLEEARAFYRAAFDSAGWIVVDVRYVPGQWMFLAVAGPSEVRVTLTESGAATIIVLELSEPVGE